MEDKSRQVQGSKRMKSKSKSQAWLEKRDAVKVHVEYPDMLPISIHVDDIIEDLKIHQVLVIAGETGSGKTTQLPKMLLQAGYGRAAKIGCTQPRRVAATSIAKQVAKELQTEVGAAVGYKIRFADKVSDQTLVQFMTDGILLAETQSDRFLNSYDALIIDEAHERSLNIDFLLGYIKQLLAKRPELRLIITSASIDTERFSQAFSDAPVIEVSGRTYPVEIQYKAIEEQDEESGDYTFLDAATAAVRDILDQTWQGDLLVFMPGEMEIREMSERLLSYRETVEVLPLYGRLTAKEQNRVFLENAKRKVIIATNIAETSLTIPGIRYVIDTGLARISRYSPKARIQRLPVEMIAQSNAIQRAGRAGRIEAGICVRLYSEERFNALREYAEPEILRTNLAGVILKMLTLKLGNPKLHGPSRIASFPFIDPPSTVAIKEGFKLLKELGAVDENHKPLKLGYQISRLPIEPQAARMILEAYEEQALREVLVIVAGLSIQDPREYPLELKEKARLEHKAFSQPESDYMTLLKIWDTYHEEWEKLGSENKMRKFCKKHFLSFVRMREWRDIYQQLAGILKNSGMWKMNQNHADYAAIHRSILSGLLTNVAQKTENNSYRSSGGKEVWVFPGSGLHKKSKEWILAGEQVETSKLYARKVANIEVEWLENLGGNLCRRTYSEPYFDENSGIVQVYEKVLLHGLIIIPKRRIPFGKVNPAEATAIFIQQALIEEKLQSKLQFYHENRQLKKRFIEQDAKLRRNREYEYEAAQVMFYTERLYNIFSIHDLNRLLKQKWAEGEDKFLFMSENDFRNVSEQNTIPFHADSDQDADSNQNAPNPLIPFPEYFQVGGIRMRIRYAFAPGEEHDGSTLQVKDAAIPYLNPQMLDWIIPGLWEEKVLNLLKTLPKTERKKFVPIPQTARILAEIIKPTQLNFGEALSELIRTEYRIKIEINQWNWDKLPHHLKLRIEVKTENGKIISTGRNIAEILLERQRILLKMPAPAPLKKNSKLWEKEITAWKLEQITAWDFELPRKIKLGQESDKLIQSAVQKISELASKPSEAVSGLLGFPGLKMDENGIQRVLFSTSDEALKESKPAFQELLAMKMGTELAWFEKDISTELKSIKDKYLPFGSLSDLKKDFKKNVRNHLFDVIWISNHEEFDQSLVTAQNKMGPLSNDWMKSLNLLLNAYQETTQLLHHFKKTQSEKMVADLWSHLNNLIPKNFVGLIAFEQWPNIKRYLKALRVRVERMQHNPEKDREKWDQLSPWLDVLQKLKKEDLLSRSQENALQEMQVLLEEYRVSLFAPELKTAIPVSEKRLLKFMKKNFPDQ